MSASNNTPSNLWPAQVIHVNEDGWILVNRGRAHGVVPGLRLLVVGTGIRELRNVMMAGDDQPLALRIRRTYEELDVLYVEESCAIAVATRAPAGRRPKFYRGPDGELLVWVPLPEGWTYPHPGTSDDDTSGDDQDSDDQDYQDSTDTSDEGAEGAGDAETPDLPPELGEQDDERWEQALPLNGVAVGDLVVPAIPAAGAAANGAAASASSSGTPSTTPNPFEEGRDYGWMKPEQ